MGGAWLPAAGIGLAAMAGVAATAGLARAVCDSGEPEYYWDGPYIYGYDLVRDGDRTLVFWSEDDGIRRVTLDASERSDEVALDLPYLRFGVASSGGGHLMVYATSQLSDARWYAVRLDGAGDVAGEPVRIPIEGHVHSASLRFDGASYVLALVTGDAGSYDHDLWIARISTAGELFGPFQVAAGMDRPDHVVTVGGGVTRAVWTVMEEADGYLLPHSFAARVDDLGLGTPVDLGQVIPRSGAATPEGDSLLVLDIRTDTLESTIVTRRVNDAGAAGEDIVQPYTVGELGADVVPLLRRPGGYLMLSPKGWPIERWEGRLLDDEGSPVGDAVDVSGPTDVVWADDDGMWLVELGGVSDGDTLHRTLSVVALSTEGARGDTQLAVERDATRREWDCGCATAGGAGGRGLALALAAALAIALRRRRKQRFT